MAGWEVWSKDPANGRWYPIKDMRNFNTFEAAQAATAAAVAANPDMVGREYRADNVGRPFKVRVTVQTAIEDI